MKIIMKFILIIIIILITSIHQINAQNNINSLFNIQQANPKFNIEIWTDKKIYSLDENINFYIKSNSDCYVTLVDFATNGDFYILYPNKFAQNNFIKKDTIYKIPESNYGFSIKVYAPKGVERIKAIASIEPITIFESMNFNNAFYKINFEDNASLQKLKNVNWAEMVYEFNIDENENVISSKGLKEEEGKLMAKPMSSAVTSEEIFNSTNVFDSSKILKRKI